MNCQYLEKDCIQCLFQTMFFGKISDEQTLMLQQNHTARHYKRGEVICTQGQAVESFMFLRKGLVKLFVVGNNGNDRIISLAKPLDCIGLMSIFSNQTYQYSITALDDSLVCLVSVDLLRQIIKENGSFALCFLEKMSTVNDMVLRNRIDLAQKQLRGRVAHILLYFAQTVYQSMQFELPVSRKEIAELIDMRTENVIRILSEFRSENLIAIDGKGIEIKELEKLAMIDKLG